MLIGMIMITDNMKERTLIINKKTHDTYITHTKKKAYVYCRTKLGFVQYWQDYCKVCAII